MSRLSSASRTMNDDKTLREITTADVLSFTTSIVAVPGSFQAGIAVPAPGTLGLFSLALLAMVVTRAWRGAAQPRL